MPTGRLKFYSEDRGFSFLIPTDEPGPDIFFGKNEMRWIDRRMLKPLQRFEYELGTHSRTGKPIALRLKLVEEKQDA